MKLNPISKILGENIKGTIVFVDQRLITDDVFNNDYRLNYINKKSTKYDEYWLVIYKKSIGYPLTGGGFQAMTFP